jgi:HK97 family phage major capsid protein
MTSETAQAAKYLDRLLEEKKREVLQPVRRPPVPESPPYVTTGPVLQDSKPFSLAKALLLLNQHTRGQIAETAKQEQHVLDEFRLAMISTVVPDKASVTEYWLPTNWNYLPEHVKQHKSYAYVKSVMSASHEYDPDRAQWLVQRGVIAKAPQSAYIDTLGGTLVPPPTLGPVIPLIRPQAGVLAAGATTTAMPVSGRLVRPRITAAPDVMAVAESQTAPETDLRTSQMELSARKIAGLVRMPVESLMFTGGEIEASVRAELERSLALKIDAYALYGIGGSSIPSGLTSAAYTGAVIDFETDYPSASGIGTNGNTLLPQYGDLLPALIGERSFNLDASGATWLMRPAAYASVLGRRADAVTAGDRAGQFVDWMRRLSEGGPSQWRGYDVVLSTNIRGDRTKGSGTNLSDVFFGVWKHCVMATYGAIQVFVADQTYASTSEILVRATMFGDVGYEYPQAFLWYKNVLGPTGY